MRIGLRLLAVFAILAMAIAVLSIRDPAGAALLAMFLILPLIANTHPPPIAEDLLANESWQNWNERSRKLTTLLQRRFPAEMNEGTLKSELLNQRFKPLPPPLADRLLKGQPTPLGRAFVVCPPYDQSKALEYAWGNGICRHTITVRWFTGSPTIATRSQALTPATARPVYNAIFGREFKSI